MGQHTAYDNRKESEWWYSGGTESWPILRANDLGVAKTVSIVLGSFFFRFCAGLLAKGGIRLFKTISRHFGGAEFFGLKSTLRYAVGVGAICIEFHDGDLYRT